MNKYVRELLASGLGSQLFNFERDWSEWKKATEQAEMRSKEMKKTLADRLNIIRGLLNFCRENQIILDDDTERRLAEFRSRGVL